MKRQNAAVSACVRLKKTTDKKNVQMLRTYASNYYNKIETKDPHPLNMIDRAVSIWLPFLVGGNPKVIVEPKINLQFKPFAYTFQLALNQWMKNMKFATRTLEPVVFASLFGMGITKTGTQRADAKKLAGYLTEEGRPYCEAVDEANYVFDIVAKDREQYKFEGDFYILPTDEAKEMYPKFADQILPDFKLYGEENTKDIENPEKIPYNELHDYTEFLDLWLPEEEVVITILPPYKGFDKILKTTPYRGPESGPYDVLSYKRFKGSTIPIPPIYTLMELDTAINVLYAKSRNQAERLKRIGVYESGGEKDAETAKNAKDGQMCGFTNVQNVKDIQLGSISQEIWEFLGFSLNQYSEQGGITGLESKMRSKTLGQDQMLMSNATRTLNFMSQKVHFFASSISEKIGYELWENPTMQISAAKKMAGIAEVSVTYNQLQQEGNFLDYYLEVEMYSMQKLSPEMKFNKMWQMITGWVLPTAQVSAQQGKTPNIPEITKALSNYADIDTEGWYLSEMPQQAELNPYQPMGGVKSADTRFGSNEGDNMNNMLTQQSAKSAKEM